MTLAELRELAQGDMRESNDLGGVLFGDWVSLPITREFLRFGISPTVGTLGMLVAGLAGVILLPFGGGWSVLAALCFVLFYVLDCVDGEVARLRGIDSYYWSFPDFFIGAGVMALFHVSLGVHAALVTGQPWVVLGGMALALALIAKKFMDACPLFLAVAHVVGAAPERRRRYLAELGVAERGATAPPVADACPPDRAGRRTRRDVIARYGSNLPALLRAAVTNFHLAMLGFLAVAVLDLFIGPWRAGAGAIDLKALFLFAYLPLYLVHVADHMRDMVKGGFLARSAATLRLLQRTCRDL